MFEYKYIAIEGNIGAGKTTLAKFLSNALNGELLLEEFNENKFLKEFYKSGQYAFHSEIQFLLDRSLQLKDFFNSKRELIISDYYPSKSLIFSKMNLSKREYIQIKELSNMLFLDVPKPEILFFIDRDIEDIMDNIHKRGRAFEKNMNLQYIKKLSEGYELWLKNINVPVIRIDAKSICLDNPLALEKSFKNLLKVNHISTQRRVKMDTMIN